MACGNLDSRFRGNDSFAGCILLGVLGELMVALGGSH